MWIRSSGGRTIRRGTATGVSKFQKGLLRLIRKKNPERKTLKKFKFEERLETPVVRLFIKWGLVQNMYLLIRRSIGVPEAN